jgi:hypothetical protein
MDPYAPPTALAPAAPASRGGWIKWVYGGLASVRFAITAVFFYLGIGWPASAQYTANVVIRVMAVGCSILGLVWIHAAFSDVNRRLFERRKQAGLEVKPGMAVGRFFIPLYNLYWLFAVHVFLAAALGALGQARPSQTVLVAGMIGSTALLAAGFLSSAEPTLAFRVGLATHIVWLVYMVLADRARALPPADEAPVEGA